MKTALVTAIFPRGIVRLLVVAVLIASSTAVLTAPATAQDDIPMCRGQVATIVGTAGDDVLTGTPGDDVIVAGKGNDSIFAGAGNDIVCGNGGADELWGEAGRDLLLGGGGADTLIGGADKDRLRGGQGADRCEAPFLGERSHRSCDDQQAADQSDVPAARALLETSRAKWAAWLIAQDTDDYGFDIRLSCECDGGEGSVDVVDGVAYWRAFTGSLESNRTLFTIDDVFDRADELLDALEADPLIIGDPETGVGAFFTLVVDSGTGFPFVVGDNGPADGGADYISTPRSVLQEAIAAPNRSELFSLDMLALTNPAPVYDELISVVATGFEDDFAPEIITEFGAPCLDLLEAEQSQCETDLDTLVGSLTFDDDPLIHWDCGFCIPTIAFMVARTGTDLAVISSADWTAALGTIDTPSEVPFLLRDNADVRARRNGSFVARTTNLIAECDPIVTRQVIERVSPSGTATVAKVGYSLEYGVCI